MINKLLAMYVYHAKKYKVRNWSTLDCHYKAGMNKALLPTTVWSARFRKGGGNEITEIFKSVGFLIL